MDKDSWDLKYREAIRDVTSRLDTVEGVITAYNTNIDAIYHVRPSMVEEAVKPYSKVLKKIRKHKRRILDEKDFLAGLIFCMSEGLGEEWSILDPNVSDWISNFFIQDELRMGGQAGNMANVLAGLGTSLVIPHVVQLPKIQADLFIDRGSIQVPRISRGKALLVPIKKAVRPMDEALIHHVFEFHKGEKLLIDGLSFEVPKDNRFVATYDDYNTRLEIDSAFFKGVEIAEKVDGAIISGYHLLHEDHIERIEPSLRQIRKWKKANPQLTVHLELGCIASPKVKAKIIDGVFPLVDSIGLNEYELVEVMDHFKSSKDQEGRYIAPKIYEYAKALLNLTGIRKITVHTKGFSIRIIKDRLSISPEKELYSLLFGSAVAANYAATGKHKELNDAIRRLNGIPISLEGLKEFNRLVRWLPPELGRGFEIDGFVKVNDIWLIFSVSRNVKHPVTTTGLGDSLTAAMFLADISAVKSS